jgi:hypothetical protein
MTLSKRLATALEAGANLSIVLLTVLLGWTILQRQCRSPGRPTLLNKPALGSSLTLANLDWSQADQTLIMAMSTSCHYCSDSGGFYRRLADLVATRPAIRLLAVLPEPVEESQRYLDQLGVKVAAIRRVPLSNLSVSATPTLILADKSGLVNAVWVGRLSPTQEQEVVESLMGRPASPLLH